MTEKRTIKILGSANTELALVHVPPGEEPIEVEVLNENIWVILGLGVEEVGAVVLPEEEKPAPPEPERVSVAVISEDFKPPKEGEQLETPREEVEHEPRDTVEVQREAPSKAPRDDKAAPQGKPRPRSRR